MSRTMVELFESRFPVGSSASTIAGRLISARARATRCCSPPEMARSGASTVAELAAAGKPSLLVPFAASADGHQKRNAEAMVDAGAAAFLLEKDLDVPGKLLTELASLLN